MGPKTEIHTHTWTNTNCLQFLSCKIMHKITAFVKRHTCVHTNKYMHAYLYTYIQMGNKYKLENPMNI